MSLRVLPQGAVIGARRSICGWRRLSVMCGRAETSLSTGKVSLFRDVEDHSTE